MSSSKYAPKSNVNYDVDFELLQACKEMREVCRCAFRLIGAADSAGKLAEALSGEIAKFGIAPGFAVRADEAIKQAEALVKSQGQA